MSLPSDDEDIPDPGRKPSTRGQRVFFVVFACLASISLAGGIAATYVYVTSVGNFEGKSGYAWLFALPVSFVVSAIALVLLYMFVKPSEHRILLANSLLGLAAIPTIALPFTLL
jgi:hypothetical protein